MFRKKQVYLLVIVAAVIAATLRSMAIMPAAQAQLLEDPTLSEALELAQTAYTNNNTRNAYVMFDDGQILHIGDITEIGADFLCFLVQPAVLLSNVTPSPASRVDRCFPLTRIVQVDLTYRVPR